MREKKCIGLFFGSFNPVHLGHLAIANYAVEFGDFNELWLVVSPQNPLKEKEILIAENHRIEMVKIAVSNLKLPIKICDVEMTLPKPSYTINTLKTLDAKNPDCEFCIIMGADSIACIEQWKNYEIILNNYKIYIYPRIGYDAKYLCKKYKTELLQAPIIEISSTFIRENIGIGRNMNAFISAEVSNYIKKNNLYTNI